MTLPNATSVLIVDRSHGWGPALRERLVEAGIRVHVVDAREAAIRFASVKKIDVAVIAYAMDDWTDELCADLKRHGVPYVFTAGAMNEDMVRWPAGEPWTGIDAAMCAN